jgi:hypothetical protein
MAEVIDFSTGRVLPLNQIQKEWVESVANEAVDNLDIADIMSLIEGMEKFYGKERITND